MRVELDTIQREIRVFEIEENGMIYLTGRYPLHALTDVTLKGDRLMARDPESQRLLSLPVRGRAQKRAVREAFALA